MFDARLTDTYKKPLVPRCFPSSISQFSLSITTTAISIDYYSWLYSTTTLTISILSIFYIYFLNSPTSSTTSPCLTRSTTPIPPSPALAATTRLSSQICKVRYFHPVQQHEICPMLTSIFPGPNAGPRRTTQAPVIIHNQGGQTYDETRTSDWDKQRWK